jgi:hypothetical protein
MRCHFLGALCSQFSRLRTEVSLKWLMSEQVSIFHGARFVSVGVGVLSHCLNGNDRQKDIYIT